MADFLTQELIKVRGWQVAPTELEAVLLSHPQIVDAAVIGVKHADCEVPLAFVVRNVETLSELDVILYLEPRLAKYKRLDGGVHFVTSIPKSISGKILKNLLRNELLQLQAEKSILATNNTL